MPYVLWTDEHFRRDDIFDTRIFCEPNRRAVEAAGPDQAEVEVFLETVRVVMNDELRREYEEQVKTVSEAQSIPYRELPERMCAISAVPWPKDMGYNPVDGARYCFHVRPKGQEDATWAIVAEDWVDLLVERWPEIKGTDEAFQLAENYWLGTPRFYGPGSSNLLIQGKVVIEGECPEEQAEFKPRPALPIPRLRKPARWAQRLRQERVRGKPRGEETLEGSRR